MPYNLGFRRPNDSPESLVKTSCQNIESLRDKIFLHEEEPDRIYKKSEL